MVVVDEPSGSIYGGAGDAALQKLPVSDPQISVLPTAKRGLFSRDRNPR
jgi:hypothetical protein